MIGGCSGMGAADSLGVAAWAPKQLVQVVNVTDGSKESVAGICALMSRVLINAEVRVVDQKKIQTRDLPSGVTPVIVFPGAKTCKNWAIPKEKLDEIKAGCSLGTVKVIAICAGAFFASEVSVFSGASKKRDWSLFSGQCHGPVLYEREYSTTKITAEVSSLQIVGDKAGGLSEVPGILMGGGRFVFPESDLRERNVVPLAKFQDDTPQTAAVIACCKNDHGNHSALLISPHFELDAQEVERVEEQFFSGSKQSVVTALRVSSEARERLFRLFLKSIDLL